VDRAGQIGIASNVRKEIFIARKRLLEFHNSFFLGKETVRTPSNRMEAHMRIRRCGAFAATARGTPFAVALSVALATISLSACGPDAGPSAPSAGTPAPAEAAPAQTAQAAQTAAQAAAPGDNTPASDTYAANSIDSTRGAPPGQASAPVQSVEASLAADSQQVAPVLSYAPGDGSRRSPTTSQ
jgi:hypothetical protein